MPIWTVTDVADFQSSKQRSGLPLTGRRQKEHEGIRAQRPQVQPVVDDALGRRWHREQTGSTATLCEISEDLSKACSSIHTDILSGVNNTGRHGRVCKVVDIQHFRPLKV